MRRNHGCMLLKKIFPCRWQTSSQWKTVNVCDFHQPRHLYTWKIHLLIPPPPRLKNAEYTTMDVVGRSPGLGWWSIQAKTVNTRRWTDIIISYKFHVSCLIEFNLDILRLLMHRIRIEFIVIILILTIQRNTKLHSYFYVIKI